MKRNLDPFSHTPSRRPPLRTVGELATEFGISPRSLGRLLVNRNGPKPVLKNSEARVTNRTDWYEPAAVRAWWAKVRDQLTN